MEKICDFYEVLGCHRGASIEEIKKQYQFMARIYHPDKNKKIEENTRFILINKAWNELKDPSLRRQYDAKLASDETDQLLIYSTLTKEDLPESSKDGVYRYPCRCGGTYVFHREDIELSDCVIACDECSFSIKVQVNLPNEKFDRFGNT